MPAYRDRLSAAELADFMTYFRAVSMFGATMPDAAYEGWKVAETLGCFGCHGPSGIGGSPNPGSFKGHIPAWDGAEYPELVENEAEFRAWTLTGRVQRLWDNPAARHFLESQVIQMPAYREKISEDQLSQLVAYVNWLRGQQSHSQTKDDTHRIMGQIAPP